MLRQFSPLSDVSSELKLVESLPSDLRAKWSLEELFQREIDWDRVETELLNGYLKRPNKLKFFNSLTVALIPLNEQGMLDHEYGDTPNPPVLQGVNPEQFKITDVGVCSPSAEKTAQWGTFVGTRNGCSRRSSMANIG